MMRFLLLLVLAFSTTILPSCKVEGDEEVTLKADGSSQIRLDYLMPDFVVTAQEGKSLVDYVYSLDEKYSGIKVSEASYRKSDGIVGDTAYSAFSDTLVGLGSRRFGDSICAMGAVENCPLVFRLMHF